MRGAPRVSISVEYVAMPGPKGPRSVKRRRAFGASATRTPFLVPMARTTRSAMIDLRWGCGRSAARDGGQDGDDVSREQLGVEPVAVAHVVAVHEDVDVAAHGAGLVAQATVQGGVAQL